MGQRGLSVLASVSSGLGSKLGRQYFNPGGVQEGPALCVPLGEQALPTRPALSIRSGHGHQELAVPEAESCGELGTAVWPRARAGEPALATSLSVQASALSVGGRGQSSIPVPDSARTWGPDLGPKAITEETEKLSDWRRLRRQDYKAQKGPCVAEKTGWGKLGNQNRVCSPVPIVGQVNVFHPNCAVATPHVNSRGSGCAVGTSLGNSPVSLKLFNNKKFLKLCIFLHENKRRRPGWRGSVGLVLTHKAKDH